MLVARRVVLLGPLVVFSLSCSAPPTATDVRGSVRGVTLPNATAVSVRDNGAAFVERHTVWVGTGLTCEQLLAEQATASPSSGGPRLFLQNTGAVRFDAPPGRTRLDGKLTEWTEDTSDPAVLRVRFVADFDDGIENAGRFEGELVAPKCDGLAAGCSTGAGLMNVAALALWLGRRRLCRPLHTGPARA
ncbi:MAG: hypothetical protein U0228_32045 [Myxococcaceae bacterium]